MRVKWLRHASDHQTPTITKIDKITVILPPLPLCFVTSYRMNFTFHKHYTIYTMQSVMSHLRPTMMLVQVIIKPGVRTGVIGMEMCNGTAPISVECFTKTI